MKKSEIKFNGVKDLLIKNDLISEVSIALKKFENNSGKMTDHIVASWPEAGKVVNSEGTGFVFKARSNNDKIEELGKYFDADLFVSGITQRKAFIKAGIDKQILALKNGLVHPAMYKG